MRGKKKHSHWKYTNRFIPPVVPSVKLARNKDVGDCGICNRYFATLCEILINKLIPFVETLVIVTYAVNILQLSVKYRRHNVVCKSVSDGLKIFLKNKTV